MTSVNRRSMLGTLGAAAASASVGRARPAAAGASPLGGVRPHPAPRPVAPVNAEVAAAHGAAYRTLPQVVVGVDVEGLMTIHTAADARAMRPRLVAQVWRSTGVLPDGLPQVQRGIGTPAELPAFEGVRRYDRLTVRMPFGLYSTVFVLEPRQRTHSRVAFYHNGHGEPLDVMRRTAQGLLDHGYVVLLFAMPFHHWNPTTLRDPNDPSVTRKPTHDDLARWESAKFSPLAFFLEPPAVAMNHVQAAYRPSSVQMVGLSGGGWTTTVYPALDPRITRSYPTAGTLPFFVRPGSPGPISTRGDWEQRQDTQPGFYGVADFPDLYALGSVGPHRRQMQILNRFDECCFSGVGHRGYEAVVRQRIAVIGGGDGAGGHWELLEDATHGQHAISPFALSVILWDLDINCAHLP